MRLGREQVVAELVRERAAHGAAEIGFALRQRHAVSVAQRHRFVKERHGIGVRQMNEALGSPVGLEHDPP